MILANFRMGSWVIIPFLMGGVKQFIQRYREDRTPCLLFMMASI